MEQTDWLDAGFDSSQARFLMVTAITHHRFRSRIWGEREVRKLHTELAEIESVLMRAIASVRRAGAASRIAGPLMSPPLLARADER